MKYAGGDLGFTSNSSAFVVSERDGDVVRVLDLLEMKPTKGAPLKPSEVYERAAEFLGLFEIRSVLLDNHYIESAREGLGKLGVRVVTVPAGADGKVNVHLAVKRLLAEGNLRLPDHPRLIAQLKAIRSRPLPGGALKITAPTKGRAHGDVASAAILAVYAAMKTKSVGRSRAGTVVREMAAAMSNSGERQLVVGRDGRARYEKVRSGPSRPTGGGY